MNDLVQDYISGMTIPKLERKYHTTNVYAYIPQNIRRRELLKERNVIICEMYRKSFKMQIIADEFNLTIAGVRHVIKMNGLKIRKWGRPRKKEMK